MATARTLDYEGVAVRVVDPDHLAALAFQAAARNAVSEPGSCSKPGVWIGSVSAPCWPRTGLP